MVCIQIFWPFWLLGRVNTVILIIIHAHNFPIFLNFDKIKEAENKWPQKFNFQKQVWVIRSSWQSVASISTERPHRAWSNKLSSYRTVCGYDVSILSAAGDKIGPSIAE